MSMVQLNGVARIVLGVALLLPRWSALSLGLGLFAWLPNYQALQVYASRECYAMFLKLSLGNNAHEYGHVMAFPLLSRRCRRWG